MHDLLAGYPVILSIPVAWGEMDAFQHVNNIVYLRYAESDSVIVSYDYRAGAKVPLPAAMRAAILALEPALAAHPESGAA